MYRQKDSDNTKFRFTGGIESITDGKTLWVRGEDLTIPVSLADTKCYLLPMHEGDGFPDAPEQINWNQVSTLTEGAKVFIGGMTRSENSRLNFISTKENPLMVIFYSCSDDDLPPAVIRAAGTHNEYWNTITPISLVIGALALIYIAASYVERPAFRLTFISSFIAVFIPLLPVIPPGFLLTVIYRRLTWSARILRSDYDLARFGLLPDFTQKSARKFAIRAYSLEIFAWIIMLLGIFANIIFIYMILIFFKVISF